MDILKAIDRFSSYLKNETITIDSHTAGESTRLIVGGVVDIKGSTMAEKLETFKSDFDHIRLMLTREPRGHSGILAAMLTKGVSEDADFGLIYMDARRYPYLCGHGTIGAVATLIKTGCLDTIEGENIIKIDTPSGPMKALALIRKGCLESVAIDMVPSFVFDTGKNIEVPEYGSISIDLVCAGGFFAMVSTKETGLDLIPDNMHRLADLGMKIIDAANEQLTVSHPLRPEVTTVDVTEFYDPANHHLKRGKNVVVYGESHIDRSPCGTGTAAKLTLLHHHAMVSINEPFINLSPLDTYFSGEIIDTIMIGDFKGVSVRIKGNAHLTGLNRFFLEPDDPFPNGFVI